MEIGNCVLAVSFCGALTWYGWQVVAIASLIDERSASELRFPMHLYYAALPTGGILMLVRYAIRLARLVAAPGTPAISRRPGGHELLHPD
jgi:C4-dicarboxylate transporter, DctQ subunit